MPLEHFKRRILAGDLGVGFDGGDFVLHGGDDVGLADCGDAMAAKLAEILRRESESVEGCAGSGIADINRVCGEDGVGAFDDDHGVM